MAPNSPACSFIHASMAGSRSTAPSNRSNSVLIISLLSPLLPTSQQSPLPRSAGLSRFLGPGRFYREAGHLGLWWHSHSWLCSLSAVAASLPPILFVPSCSRRSCLSLLSPIFLSL